MNNIDSVSLSFEQFSQSKSLRFYQNETKHWVVNDTSITNTLFVYDEKWGLSFLARYCNMLNQRFEVNNKADYHVVFKVDSNGKSEQIFLKKPEKNTPNHTDYDPLFFHDVRQTYFEVTYKGLFCFFYMWKFGDLNNPDSHQKALDAFEEYKKWSWLNQALISGQLQSIDPD
jgi:hypothetical protein